MSLNLQHTGKQFPYSPVVSKSATHRKAVSLQSSCLYICNTQESSFLTVQLSLHLQHTGKQFPYSPVVSTSAMSTVKQFPYSPVVSKSATHRKAVSLQSSCLYICNTQESSFLTVQLSLHLQHTEGSFLTVQLSLHLQHTGKQFPYSPVVSTSATHRKAVSLQSSCLYICNTQESSFLTVQLSLHLQHTGKQFPYSPVVSTSATHSKAVSLQSSCL